MATNDLRSARFLAWKSRARQERPPGRHPTAARRRKAGWPGQHHPERRPWWELDQETPAKRDGRCYHCGQKVMPKLLTEQRRPARELRDACMLLTARYGLAAQRSGTHLTQVVLDLFQIWLTPAGGRPIKAADAPKIMASG